MADNKAKPGKGKPSQASKGKANAADDDDFDSICDAFAAVNSKCNVKGNFFALPRNLLYLHSNLHFDAFQYE